jgi:predicted small lipoprotein YifL
MRKTLLALVVIVALLSVAGCSSGAPVTFGPVTTDASAELRTGFVVSGYEIESYADLSYADLSYADLSYAYLTGADLSYAYLTGADLTGADLTGADLTGADLSYAYLSYADLTGADLTGADLTGTDLTGAEMPAGWEEMDESQTTEAPADLFPNSRDTYAFLSNVKAMSSAASLLEDSYLIEQGDFYCDFVRQNEWRGSSSIYGAIVSVVDETAQGNQEVVTLSVALIGQALFHLCPEFSYVITENVQ